MIKEKLLERGGIPRIVDRYVAFIEKFSSDQKTDVAHHILPKGNGCWPEYSDLKKHVWNSANLTHRQHFIAHWILVKAFPENDAIVYAFNMMSNIHDKKSREFHKEKSHFSKMIKARNTGIKRSDEFKKSVSSRIKNTLVVKTVDDEENLFRISKDDFIEGYHIPYRTGTKHSEETKRRIGRKGKKSYINTVTGKITFSETIPIGDGWGLGSKSDISKKASERFTGRLHYHNQTTGETGRFFEGCEPLGWTKGRLIKDNKGLSAMNEMQNVVDFKNRKCVKIRKDLVDRRSHGPDSSRSTDETFIFSVDNFVFTSLKSVISYQKSKNVHIPEKLKVCDFDKFRVPASHHNCSDEVNKFRAVNSGKSMKDLGVSMKILKEFYMKETDRIYWNE